MFQMKRGEVWWVNFNPSIGGEIRKVRPAIIISNDSANKSLNRLQVIPITSNIEKVFPSEALITLEGKTMKAAADKITTASKLRLTKKMGDISIEDLRNVETAIKTQLDLI